MNYNNNLETFLGKFKVASSNVKWNLVSMGEKFKGKFYIDSSNLEEFYKLYKEAANNKIKLSIAEKPQDYGPILVDIDLKIIKDQYKENTRLYTNDMIILVIDTYREAIKKYLTIEKGDLDASLFEKRKPTIKENEIKDGFHIIFNSIIAHYKLRYLIRAYVVEQLKSNKLFNGFVESVEKIIDKAIINTNCWLLPNSKKPDGHKYKLTTIYNDKYQDNKVNGDLVKFYSLLDPIHCKDNETDFNDNYTFTKIEEEFENLGKKPKQEKIKDKKDKKNEFEYNEGKTKEEFIEKLVDLLDDSRANDRDDWKDICFIINNELGSEGLNLFQSFSNRSDKYSSKDDKWYLDLKPNDKGLFIGSLIDKVKEDNLEGYKELYKEFIKPNKKEIEKSENMNESQENYNKIKIEFEKNNFKVINPIMFVTIGKNKETIIRSKKEFKDVYENLRYLKFNEFNKQMVMSSFIDDWLKDANMRTYDKLDFLPQQEAPENVYNTFTGFEAANKELFDVNIEDSLLMKHIKNICGNNDEFTNYFINWLSNVVQNPMKISGVMVLFSSPQGVGKDTIFNYMGQKILGSKYYVNEDKLELLFGRFNGMIENKLLIVINEASGKDTFKIDNNIKNAITRTTNTIEHKGCKPYEVNNCASFAGFSNNSVSFKIEPTDRRFTAQECNKDIAQNAEYFDALYNELNSGILDRAFYEYLMKRDIKNYNFQSKRPITRLYNDMKEACIPLLAKYFGNLIDTFQSKETLDFKAGDAYNKYIDYIKNGNYKYETNLTQFGRELNEYKSISKIKKRDGIHYIINLVELKEHLIKSKLYNDDITFIDDEETDSESEISSLDK